MNILEAMRARASADIIDHFCVRCEDSARDGKKSMRDEARDMVAAELRSLMRHFPSVEDQRTIRAFQDTCAACFRMSGGRSGALEKKYTCGLRSGILRGNVRERS